MNFRPQRRDPPELNLIPMIDVLIVLLIFLVLTTTFSREGQLHLQLPTASTGSSASDHATIRVVVDEQGAYRVNQQDLPDDRLETLQQALKSAAAGQGSPFITIAADRAASHQTVMQILDAAGRLGFQRLTFATERGFQGASGPPPEPSASP